MEELVIKTHDFEEAKNQLKKFSEETTTDLDLKRVDSEKSAGEFFKDFFLGRGIGTDHIVTGDEFNSLIEDIQHNNIDFYNMLRSFSGEIGHVYSALEALDRDYIQAILIAVKSAQKANEKAMDAHGDIKKAFEEQEKIIKVLQQFKEKIDKFKHIVDIDSLWNDMQTISETINLLDSSITKLVIELEKQGEIVDSREETITKITSQKFIYSIDETKELVDSLAKKVDAIITDSSLMKQSIDIAMAKIEKVENITHLFDINNMYDEVQSLKETINNLNETKDSLIEENGKLSNHIEEIEKGFAKKVTIAYALAGGTIGLAIIEFVLAIMGLI